VPASVRDIGRGLLARHFVLGVGDQFDALLARETA
jgi:hypothetical protein